VVDKSADFAGEAKKAGADLKETGLFTEAQPDAALQKEESLAPAAFKLTPDAPNSDPDPGVNVIMCCTLSRPCRASSLLLTRRSRRSSPRY